MPSPLLLRLPPIPSMYTLSVVLASVLLATSVRASEGTNATCTQDSFLTNDEGVNPCELAVKLEGACFNDNFFLRNLPEGQEYNGPAPDTSNTCQCSSVTYSVVMACAACQGGSITPWLQWSANCVPDQIAIGSYPVPLQNVSVPAWAFANVSASGTFNPNEASASASLPETVLTATHTSTTTGTGPSNTAASSKSSSHTGAIVGGVVGGLVAVALICVGAFFVYRRHRKSRRDQPRSIQEKVDMTGPSYGYTTDSYSLAPPKLYDPADPTTFPQSPAPTTSNSLWTGTNSPPPTSPGHRHGNSSGSYSGFPEL